MSKLNCLEYVPAKEKKKFRCADVAGDGETCRPLDIIGSARIE